MSQREFRLIFSQGYRPKHLNDSLASEELIVEHLLTEHEIHPASIDGATIIALYRFHDALHDNATQSLIVKEPFR